MSERHIVIPATLYNGFDRIQRILTQVNDLLRQGNWLSSKYAFPGDAHAIVRAVAIREKRFEVSDCFVKTSAPYESTGHPQNGFFLNESEKKNYAMRIIRHRHCLLECKENTKFLIDVAPLGSLPGAVLPHVIYQGFRDQDRTPHYEKEKLTEKEEEKMWELAEEIADKYPRIFLNNDA